VKRQGPRVGGGSGEGSGQGKKRAGNRGEEGKPRSKGEAGREGDSPGGGRRSCHSRAWAATWRVTLGCEAIARFESRGRRNPASMQAPTGNPRAAGGGGCARTPGWGSIPGSATHPRPSPCGLQKTLLTTGTGSKPARTAAAPRKNCPWVRQRQATPANAPPPSPRASVRPVVVPLCHFPMGESPPVIAGGLPSEAAGSNRLLLSQCRAEKTAKVVPCVRDGSSRVSMHRRPILRDMSTEFVTDFEPLHLT